MRGRLAQQDPKDEPADELLVQIMKQRRRASHESGGKALQPLPPILPAEVPYRLPQGWAWARLGNIGDTNIGLTYSPRNLGETGVPVLRSSNIQNGKIDLSDLVRVAVSPKKSVLVEVGDLLICARNGSRNLVGKTALIEHLSEQTAFGAFMAVFRSSINQYLYHFICSPLFREMIDEVSTTTINQITQTNLRSTIAPVPPLAEQKRIVAKVDELMRLCSELEARQQARRISRLRLNNVTLAPLNDAASLAPEEFEQASVRLADNFAALYDSAGTVVKLRSTILQLAIQGKLVVQDPNDEPASELLQPFGDEIEKLKKDNGIAEVEQNAHSFPVPSGWSRFRLGELIKFIGGSQPPKSRFIYQPADGYTRLVQIRDYKSDAFKTYVPSECANRPVTKDDVMIGRYGPPVFQILRGLEGTYNVALMKADPIENVVSKNYLFYLLQEPKLQNLVVAESERTAGQSGVRKELLHNYVAALPPLEEQKRIVAKVNQLMALCDELEAKLCQAEADSEKLMNAAIQHVLETVSGMLSNGRVASPLLNI